MLVRAEDSKIDSICEPPSGMFRITSRPRSKPCRMHAVGKLDFPGPHDFLREARVCKYGGSSAVGSA